MLSLQSQLCAIRGAFHLCFKGTKPKSKTKTKKRALKCFLQCWFCLYTFLKPVGLEVVCSSLPSIAQLPLPITWRRQFQSREKMTKLVCVCVQRRNDWERHWTPPPGKQKTGRESQGGNVRACVCACVPWKSLSNSKPQPKCTFASPEKPLTLSANVQDEIQTNFLLSFFFPHLFLNRCCGFLFYYTRSAERQKKKKSLIHFFPPTKLSEKELCVNLLSLH